MEFSESFGFGSSTFDNLESQINRAIDDNEKQSKKTKQLDIIVESPEGKQKGNLTNSHARLLQNSKNETQRRHWRRSKSDSKLLVKEETTADSKNERLTQFFTSDLGFSMEQSVKNNNDLKEIKVNVVKEESQLRVSQIEADFEDDNNEIALVSAWEIPICSEDINQITQTEDDEMSVGVLKISDSLEFENLSSKSEQDENVKNDAESIKVLDATSFILPIEDEAAKEHLNAELKATQQEIRQDDSMSIREIAQVQRRQLNFSKNLSIKSPKQLNSTRLLPCKTLPSNAESFKYISSWNLPQSVVGQYKKKRIIEMFDWQVECLSNPKVLLEHCNLVYSAPTSAGKTLVSEILLLKTVIERNKKVLMILPFISVVREKMFYLQDLLTPAGYRVEGFFGGYTPPGGFDSINVAICTIEKANSIVNKLLEQNKLESIGTVVVDEIHLISDAGRGYILELLIAKILYMSRKYGLQIQVITMSATLANVELLKRWLDAELFITNYRPVALQEMIKVGTKIFNANMQLIRDLAKPAIEDDIENVPILPNDADNVAQLCLETVLEGCSAIVFCPSKDWCEKLAVQLASIIHGLGKSGSDLGSRLRKQLNREAIDEVKRQLNDIPTGLDTVLEKTITFGCAFHHAGLTTEERDIVEASFKSGALKIIVATSTLSSGVNLPARRVLIRTPLFGGKQMSSLTYKQMIGRAGRTGKDTLGESILICTESNARIGRDLVTAELQPINSCLEMEGSTHLKRALLEVISSGVAVTKDDIKNFVNCTLLSAQKRLKIQEKDSSTEGEEDFISGALDFLIEYEFVRLQTNTESGEENYVATRLGLACLASSMPPTDGLILFSELQKCRRCFVLESELHAVYLVTPYSVCYQMQEIDWLFFLDLWEKLSPAMRKVGELVGVKESFLVRAMRGQTKLDYKLMQIHKRFYTALALQELVNETPINVVAQKYKCTRGLLQSLQQMASTFAGIVTAFCNALQWDTLSLIVSQFKERLFFGIHRDLIDLMRLPDLSHKRARAFFDAGITTLIELAQTDVLLIEKILYNSLSFDSAKQHENENSYEAEQRNLIRNFFITGKANLTVAEAAKLLIQEARQFVEYEVGAGKIKWTQETVNEDLTKLHMSCEENGLKVNKNHKKRKSNEDLNEVPLKLNKSVEDADANIEVKDLEVMHKKYKNDDEGKENIYKGCKNKRRDILEDEKGNIGTLKENKEKKKKPESCEKDYNTKTNTETNSKRSRKNGVENQAYKNKDLGELVDQKSTNSNNNRTSVDLKSDGGSNIFTGKTKEKSEIARKNAKLDEVLENLFGDDFNDKESKAETNSPSFNLREKNKISENNRKIEIISKENVISNAKSNSKENGNTISTFSLNSKDETFTLNDKNIKRNLTETKTQKISKCEVKNPQKNGKQTNVIEKPKSPKVSNKISNHQLKSNGNHLLEQPTHQPKPNVNNFIKQTNHHSKPSCDQQPRRSPRNHSKTSTTNQDFQDMQDLFADEESFELNSCLSAALDKVESKIIKDHKLKETNDEIPSSQVVEEDQPGSSSMSPALLNGTPRHTSRLLRSIRTNATQRLPSPLAKKNEQLISEIEKPIQNLSEDSDISLDLTNSPYVVQMNASHILSCSKKEETISSSFNAVEIIDICGNLELFKLAMKELLTAKRFGFCLGVQQLNKQKRPLIGGNLLINQLNNEANCSIETPKLFQIDDDTYLEGIAFCINENIVLFINLQLTESDNSISKDIKIQCLKKLLKNSEIKLIIYEARKQLKLLKKAIPDLEDIQVKLEDPKVANWLLQPDQRLSLKNLAQQFAPECSALVDLCGGGRGYNSHGIDASSAIMARIRCSVEACTVVHILQGQIENLERIGTGELLKFFHELEMPLQLSLCKMESIGFPASEMALRDLFQKMLESAKKLETKIFNLHGKRFNLSSAQAVARVLGLHRKSNGRVSTSRQVLEKIDEPISKLIIAYRKLNVTMTKNIQPLLHAVQNDRIHGQSDSFTATGRISMKEPNLQNVAKNFEIDYGTEKINISCRSAFFPNDSNRCLISADFCQLEMRILAHLSKDPLLIKTVSSENDIFTAIAAVWNNIEETEVSETLRNGTKQICYGIIYGMGIRSLAEGLKCNEDEAKLVSEQFHEAYPAIRAFTNKIINDARCNGYVETIQGRRRYLENIKSVESSLKNQAERQAVNSTIQGSAADIAKRAILRSEKSIIKYGPKLGLSSHDVNFVLHVHDELIFEVPISKAKKIAKIISLTMESCIKLSVPLKVKLKMGRNWGEMKEIIS